MEVEKTTSRWFDETAAKMEKYFKTNSQIDMLCAGTLKVATNYCNAVFLLLKNGHKMPAKALLRVLCELTAKLVWCLLISNEDKQNADDIIYEKFQRWQKSTYVENKKLLESLREAVPGKQKSELDNKIESLRKNAEQINLSPMPKLTKVFEELHGDWKTKIRPACYMQFNNAIHPDLKAMSDLIKIEGNKIICLDDSEDSINDLSGFCLDWAYHVNYFIRRHYNWDTKKIDDEYKQLA